MNELATYQRMLDPLIGRRKFLYAISLALGAGSLARVIGVGALPRFSQQNSSADDLNENSLVPLNKSATAKGLLFGAAATFGALTSDKNFAALVRQQCGIVVSELDFKWEKLSNSPFSYNFTKADWLVDFCRRNNIFFRGHTLVWHAVLPKWFSGYVNASNAEEVLKKHVSVVVGRYAGKVHSWDIVNEATAPEEGNSRGLRISSVWYELLGEKYIDIAFKAAALADPKAMLVYNDYGIEYDTPADEAKRAAVLKLLVRLKKSGVPVHALGIQAHLYGDEKHFNPAVFKKFLKQVADLGLKIIISELDVADNTLIADVGTRDRIVSDVYSAFLTCALAEPAVIAVLTWGLSDRYTWLPYYRPRKDHLPARPLPFDKDLHPKPAYYAMTKAFDGAPQR